jgi:glycosyltransferase involved in cell wall biosynthesis
MPIRIALLATSIDFGGIERVLLNLLQHMDGEIEFVPIVFTRADAKETTFFDRMRAMNLRHETIYVDAFKPKYVNAAYNVAEAREALRGKRIDLIHSHGYRADTIGICLSKWLRLPLLSTCHGFVPNDRRLRFYNNLDTFLLRRFDGVIAVSTQMKRDLMDSGVPEERIRVIANAVSAAGDGAGMDQRTAIRARLGIGEADFVFGYVGRLSEEKGLDHLLQAAGELRGEASTSRILLVGDGPRRQDLEEVARGRGILDRVHFAGFQRDTPGWYRAMDAFVLPSLTEGTPMALLEAMAQGLTVVGTSVGGVPAVVTHGENGLLVPPADAAALGGALTQLASEVQLRRRLSAGALRTVRERYSVEAWTREVRSMYLATVQSCRRRS